MAIHDLARRGTPHGTVTAVWFDSDGENFVVQHEFVHLSFHKREFTAFLDCLNASYEKYVEDHGAAPSVACTGSPKLRMMFACFRAGTRSASRAGMRTRQSGATWSAGFTCGRPVVA